MNEKKLIFAGKFYLKSGCVVEEEVVFDEDNEESSILEFVEEMKNNVKLMIRDNINGQTTFGFTVFRNSDISAVKFELK